VRKDYRSVKRGAWETGDQCRLRRLLLLPNEIQASLPHRWFLINVATLRKVLLFVGVEGVGFRRLSAIASFEDGQVISA
jgi:hypothetical protein